MVRGVGLEVRWVRVKDGVGGIGRDGKWWRQDTWVVNCLHIK